MTITNGNETGARERSQVSRMFREVNDRIREAAGRVGGDDQWDFICECDDLDCVEMVSLTLDDFDSRRVRSASRIVADHA
jgi:hypothetical protein